MGEYVKHIWERGDTITVDLLNNIENNIATLMDNANEDNTMYIHPEVITNPTTVSSNASTVINTTLAKAAAAGKHYVVIPDGEYWLTETVYLKSDVILKGCGMDATTLKIADGCDIDAIRVSEPVNNSGIMDLSIDGNRIENYSVYSNGHHGNAINVWLHYGRIERVRTNWVYKHSLLLNYDTGNSDDGLGFTQEHQNDMGNLNKVLWCDFRDSLLQGIMWGWRTMDSWMCYTNVGSHAANLYLEGGTSRFIGNHFDGDGDNGAGPEYNVYCGDGCTAMMFAENIFENTQKENIYFRQPSYSNQTMTITIANNIIRTCSKSQNNQYANIYISGYSTSVPAKQIIIANNQILNPDTNANHGYAGIHLVNCDGVKIEGNAFFNVGSNEVLVDSSCVHVVNDNSFVQDVQVNGTSILNQGVANVPKATSSALGVASFSSGLFISSTGNVVINKAQLSNIKSGENQYLPIVPYNQHQSVFYGLAKASGDTTQASSANEVGTYTADALVKIQKMLGIYEAPWELIRDDSVTNATEAGIDITVDANGNTFELTDVRGVIWFPTQNNEAKCAGGTVQLLNNGNVITSMAVDTKTVSASSTLCGAYFMMEQKDGMMFQQTTGWHNRSVMGTVRMTISEGRESVYYPFKIMNETAIDCIRIPKITGTLGYTIFGKRKWRT